MSFGGCWLASYSGSIQDRIGNTNLSIRSSISHGPSCAVIRNRNDTLDRFSSRRSVPTDMTRSPRPRWLCWAAALGTVAAEILTRAGVGHLRLIDRDVVEWTNLQRQSLYIEQDAIEGRSKADAACERLTSINSSIEIAPIVADVTSSNIRGILDGVDLVIDAADNFLVRFLLNDWAISTATPWVHGGCIAHPAKCGCFAAKDHHVFAAWSQSRHQLPRSIPVIPPASLVRSRT